MQVVIPVNIERPCIYHSRNWILFFSTHTSVSPFWISMIQIAFIYVLCRTVNIRFVQRPSEGSWVHQNLYWWQVAYQFFLFEWELHRICFHQTTSSNWLCQIHCYWMNWRRKRISTVNWFQQDRILRSFLLNGSKDILPGRQMKGERWVSILAFHHVVEFAYILSFI